MKKFLFISLMAAFSFGLLGCETTQDKLSGYFQHPRSLLKDPHFLEYQKKNEELEWAYLHNEIDFAEYQERRKRLDDQYEREVQEREAKIRGER